MTHLPFVELSYMPSLLHELNRTLDIESIGLLQGLRGTGKSTLLRHWITQAIQYAYADQVVVLNLRPTSSGRDVTGVYSAKTLYLLQQIHYELKEKYLVREQRSLSGTRGFSASQAVHTQRGFARMEQSVIHALDDNQIRALVVDDAQHIDALTLEWLTYLRTTIEPNIALVLCGVVEEQQEMHPAITQALRNVPNARDRLTTKLLIPRMTHAEWVKTLPYLLVELRMQPTAGMMTTLWEWSHGNWHQIKKMLDLCRSYCDQVKPTITSEVRTVTPEVLQMVVRTMADTTIP